MKSVLGRVHPFLKTVSELAVVSASPTPLMAPTSSEAIPPKATVARVKSLEQMVEKGVEKRGTSKLGKPRVDDFGPHTAPLLESTRPQSPCCYHLWDPVLRLTLHISPLCLSATLWDSGISHE